MTEEQIGLVAVLPEKDDFSLGDLVARWGCSESDLSDYVRTGKLAALVMSPTGENLGTFIDLQERKRIASVPNTGGVLLWARAIGEEAYILCDIRILREERDRFEHMHGIETFALHFKRGTLEEAAAAVAKQNGWHNGSRDGLLKQMVEAVKDRSLTVRDPLTDLPYGPNIVRTFYEQVTVGDLNAWLERQGVDYRLAVDRPEADQQAQDEPPVNTNCITSPPQRQDDWYEVIEVMAREFYCENRRCPTDVEAWERLHNNPPKSYGVTHANDRGEQAISMGEKKLGKRAFSRRWENYTRSAQ